MSLSVPRSGHGELGERRRSFVFLGIGLVIGMLSGLPTASSQAIHREGNLLPARPFWKVRENDLPETQARNSYELLQVLLPVKLEDGPKTRLATYVWWAILRLDGCPGHEEPIWMALAKDLKDFSFRGNLVVLHGNLNRIIEEGTRAVAIPSRLQVESYELVDGPQSQLNRIGADMESLRIRVADPLPMLWFDVPSLALVVVSSNGTLQFDGPLRLDDPTEATLCRNVAALVAGLRREQGYSKDHEEGRSD